MSVNHQFDYLWREGITKRSRLLFQKQSASISPASLPFKPRTVLSSHIPLTAAFSLVLSCGCTFFFLFSQSRPSRYLCLPLLTCACNNHCLSFFSSLFLPLPQLWNPRAGLSPWELQRTRASVTLGSGLDDHCAFTVGDLRGRAEAVLDKC